MSSIFNRFKTPTSIQEAKKEASPAITTSAAIIAAANTPATAPTAKSQVAEIPADGAKESKLEAVKRKVSAVAESSFTCGRRLSQ